MQQHLCCVVNDVYVRMSHATQMHARKGRMAGLFRLTECLCCNLNFSCTALPFCCVNVCVPLGKYILYKG